jgi:acetyltransferase
MMEHTKIYTALKGVRGQDSVDMAGIEQLLVRFSELVVEQPAIAELDINPLLASPSRLLALDARVILHPHDVADEDLPKPAIRPYPRQYVKSWISDNDLEFLIRPIRPEDESLVVDFHGRLSGETVYQRYFTKLGYEQRVAHERLVRVCFTDYDREIALVAERTDRETGKLRIAGVARLIRLHDPRDAEFSVIVADDYQGIGLGREMVSRLIEVGRQEGIDRIVAEMLGANTGMVRICQDLGFEITADEDAETIQAQLRLS